MDKMCSKQRDVERWFDGELTDASIESHIDSCTGCREHVAFLTVCRASMEALGDAPKISDGQMPAFLDGIREEVQGAPSRSFRGLWAMASMATAAVIVAVSMMTITSTGPEPVAADSIVETVSTEIDGASVELFKTDDDTQTVWLNVPEDGEL